MRVDSGGVGIHVVENGPSAGVPVVVLHGIFGSAAGYDFLPSLLPEHRLIRMDLRGHGQSDRTPGRYHLDDYAADVQAVVEQLPPPVVMVAHSFGGMLAVRVAQWRPDLVRALFLEDAGLYASDPDWMEVSGFGAGFPIFEQSVRAWQDAGASPEAIAAELRQTRGDGDEPDAASAGGYSFSHVDLDLFAPILDATIASGFDADIPIPTPGVLLKTDPAVGGAFLQRDVARLHASNPQIEVVTVPGAGHLMHGTRAHRPVYLDHLRRFLDRWTTEPSIAAESTNVT